MPILKQQYETTYDERSMQLTNQSLLVDDGTSLKTLMDIVYHFLNAFNELINSFLKYLTFGLQFSKTIESFFKTKQFQLLTK